MLCPTHEIPDTLDQKASSCSLPNGTSSCSSERLLLLMERSVAIWVCPACGYMTNVVAFPRLSAVLTYYLCKTCGHIWAVHKNNPTIIRHFTPLRNKPE